MAPLAPRPNEYHLSTPSTASSSSEDGGEEAFLEAPAPAPVSAQVPAQVPVRAPAEFLGVAIPVFRGPQANPNPVLQMAGEDDGMMVEKAVEVDGSEEDESEFEGFSEDDDELLNEWIDD